MGDRAKAEAIRIAHEKLQKAGWGYDAKDIGKYAAEILKALDTGLSEATK